MKSNPKLIFAVLTYLLPFGLAAQSFDTEFGKNRVQYNNDFKYWSQYESENFIVYWYGLGKNIAHTTIQFAEVDHEAIRKQIEHRINDKIEILVYTDLSDLKQTNIGSEEILNSESGETKIIGNKMLVYFDGNHQHLRNQIKEGIASVYFSSMLFGSNFQEVIQNAVLLDLPLWYKPGFISYVGSPWNIEIEDELRNIFIHSPDYYNFKKISQKYPVIAGHAMWYYLKSNYGKSAVSNLLYLTRISRNFNKSVEFVLNTSINQIYNEWSEFYKNKYALEKDKLDMPVLKALKLKNKRNKISEFALSPDGKKLLYAVNDLGKCIVYLYDSNTKTSVKIFKSGFKNKFQEVDLEYPHLAWSKTGTEFLLTYQRKDKIYLRKYDAGNKKFIENLLVGDYQRIYDVDFIDDRYLLINASINGNGDLSIYDLKDRVNFQLTNDFYDDLDAKLVEINGSRCILFSSNRTIEHILPMKLDTILPLGNFDIFYYKLDNFKKLVELKDGNKSLVRITNTPEVNERQPLLIDENNLLFKCDATGIINSYKMEIGSERLIPLSNFHTNLLHHSLSENGEIYAYMQKDMDFTKIYIDSVKNLKQSNPYKVSVLNKSGTSIQYIPKPEVEYVEIPENLKFQSHFPDQQPVIKINEAKEDAIESNEPEPEIENKSITKINNVLITAAGLKFRIDKLTSRMDNDVLFEGMELAQGNNDEVNTMPMGFLAKASFTDLFEDYHIEAGTRISTSLDGVEYFVNYDNEKNLLDKRFSIYMRRFSERAESEFIPPLKSKKHTMLGMYRLKYPFDIHQSLRATSSLRLDRQYFKATEINTLGALPTYEKRLGLKLEFVFDNSFEYSTNILHGTRMKFYIEGHNQFDFDFSNGFNVDLSKGFTGVLGFDARHYISFLSHSIIALRATSAWSFGSKQNLYYLGSVNNSLFPSFDNDIALKENFDFAFKTNVPNLRGFKSNIRNGSRYALLNTEIRMPVFKYILGRNRGAGFLRNFQIVGFFDAGMAWYGSGPYSNENPLNSVQVDDVLIDLDIQYFRDPLVYGFGYGIRTQILGYFVRLDVANGVETKRVLPKTYHISVGLDF